MNMRDHGLLDKEWNITLLLLVQQGNRQQGVSKYTLTELQVYAPQILSSKESKFELWEESCEIRVRSGHTIHFRQLFLRLLTCPLFYIRWEKVDLFGILFKALWHRQPYADMAEVQNRIWRTKCLYALCWQRWDNSHINQALYISNWYETTFLYQVSDWGSYTSAYLHLVTTGDWFQG